jgi:DNA gyrase subunit A
MAKQLNLLSTGQVITTALHTEMQRSYLEYAMSVIVGRALPDVRDGLKPVHRRILYAMHELGLTPDRPYRKCARVVGDVLGKYHPHGDQAVYDALVRLVQDFSSRYPLLGGHGNFGSVDNDPPAAMRYTETRLSFIGHEGMLTEIGEETVDFAGNFDNSQEEPTVLPAQLPFLILNGCSGIAVGMATNIPPHNLDEVVDGLIALIDNPELTDAKLFELIPGPDFPTGGEIVGDTGIREAYTTGRGSIVLRGIAQIEEVPGTKGNKRRTAIVITELPYQVNKAGWIEKVAELVNLGRLQGISDLRDESDRDGMRVVIELKRDTNPQEVLSNLYHQTALQTNFGAILLALVDGLPRQLSLRNLLQEFLNFREHTLNRRYSYELGKAESRSHLVEGLLKALSNVDEVIGILRGAADGSTAKVTLCSRLELTEVQADAILAMPLRRLTGLERKNLEQEFAELTQQINSLRGLLSDRKELLKALKKDLRSLKRKFSDSRRTRLGGKPLESEVRNRGAERASGSRSKGAEEEQEGPSSSEPGDEVVLEFTQRGYVRRLSATRKSKLENAIPDNDFVIQSGLTDTEKDLLILNSGGKVYPIKVGDIPATTGRTPRGTPLITLLSNTAQGTQEAIVNRFLLPENLESSDMVMLTKQGRIKRLSLGEFTSLTRRGITILKLKDDDELLFTQFIKPGEHITIAGSGGRLLKFAVSNEQLPVMGRTAVGLQGLRLLKHQQMVGCVAGKNGNLLLVTQEGYGKRMSASELKLANRGDLGIQGLKFSSKTDNLAAMVTAAAGSEVGLVTNKERIVRLAVDSVPTLGREHTGERILQLGRDEKIIAVVEVRPS